MNYYETIFISTPEYPAEKVPVLLEKIKHMIQQDNGEVVAIQEWGKKKLAYKIGSHREGSYIFIDYKCDGKAIRGLENMLKLDEGILRYLTIRKKPGKPTPPPAPAPAQQEVSAEKPAEHHPAAEIKTEPKQEI